ncbi:hypothetical protein Mal52_43680 [Symmachiella dynata]|uniref:Uncharacterized protein n=1 Tax=Symmachiella dynata TaxID=2527995 RepID=A0A517ZTQ8_9PLAN|nr:hypothetical protein Mal52_43680 [Symmachiella dynata]
MGKNQLLTYTEWIEIVIFFLAAIFLSVERTMVGRTTVKTCSSDGDRSLRLRRLLVFAAK